MEKILNDTEAAIFLGITKELLYAYVRNAPKKHLGHGRKLKTEIVDGENYFNIEELREFDSYLREPWSKPEDKRPEIPKFIQEYLKTEIDGKCPISGKGYPLDNAHIISYSESLNHHHHNLIRISKEEHTKADNGVIPSQMLQKVKNLLIDNLRNRLKIGNGKLITSIHTPNPNHVFVGRKENLLELFEAIENQRLIIIEGLGGIGKTELLLNALNNVKLEHEVIWINVESVGCINDLIMILNNKFLQFSGKPIVSSIIDVLRKTKITIVLDSLEKLLLSQRDETEDFIKEIIIQTRETQIILTSQIDLSILDLPKKIIKLKGLNTAESLSLWIYIYSDIMEIPQEYLDWLLHFCNGHPLSIKLIISLIRFHKSYSTVIEQLNHFGSLRRPMRTNHDKSTALDVCLNTIYNNLTDNQKEILHYIKYFPGGFKVKMAELQFEKQSFITDIAYPSEQIH